MNIVWDFGGVLFRWRPAVLLARALPHRAPDEAAARALAAEFFRGYTGEWHQFDLGLISIDELKARTAARTGFSAAELDAVLASVREELVAIPETVALLQAQREAGHRLYYLSNMPAPLADQLEQANPFLQWFHDGVFSARVQLAKPDAAIFEHAAARFGAAPGELLFLDDHPDNVQAALRAGWQAIQVQGPAQLAEALRAHGL